MRIPVPPNFSFKATVVSHGWYLLAPFDWSKETEILRRPEVLGGKPYDLEISAGDDGLLVRNAPKSSQRELRRKLSRMFQLDVDTSEFVTLTRTSPAHAWVEKYGFGRLLCGSTLFEDVVKIIATTNTTWQQTMRMTDLLVEKCGRRTRGGNAAFPEPEDIVRFSEGELQADCRLGYRAKTIRAAARGFVEGEFADLTTEAQRTTEEQYAQYQRLPGIGPYGAAHLLAMDGRHDFIAVDTEFRKFVRETYHKGRKVTDRAMLRRYAKWGRWKYLAYWSELWSTVADRLQPLKTGDQ